MLTSEGPKVIEFNARFGDPETQSYMRLLRSDIVPALVACSWGNLEGVSLEWRNGAVACISLASGGYPGEYEKGKEIKGVGDADQDDCIVFHAGTKCGTDGILRTNGGRVLNVTATGASLKEALARAYEGVASISFEGMHYRRDIGAKSLH
jgi:phosphoribosylamine--glycine ligase